MHDATVQARREQNRDHRLATAMNRQSALAAAHAELERRTWREPIRLLQARRALTEAQAARAQAVVSAEDLGHYASRMIQLHLVAQRNPGGRYGSNRHPLHHEVDPYFDQLVEDVAAGIAVLADQPGALPWSSYNARTLERRRASELPELLELLTAAAVRVPLTRQRDKVRAVVADTAMLTEEDDEVLTVQHAASGLRACFKLTDTVSGVGDFGTIFSKHYRIPSIDPRGSGEHPDYFEGLGIGAMVYRHGAAQHPDVRWIGGAASAPAAGLRRRLHAADPYIWDGACTVCTEHFQDDLDWAQRARDDFPPHRPLEGA